jgi:hypothetical protein
MAISYNSNYIETLPFSDACSQVACTTNVEEVVNVPGTSTTQYQAYFGYNQSSNVYVRLNGTPTIPSPGSVGSEPYNEFRPKKRYVRGGDVIHFITPDATAYVGVSLRQLQGS